MSRERDYWKLTELVVGQGKVKRTLLHGPPGTGKTTFGVRAGDPAEVYKVTLHEEMSAAELVGHFKPEGDKFVWHDGIAIRAWKNGGRLVLDEIDRASGDVLTILYAILDDPGIAALTLATGQTVQPQPGFSVVATMNGHPNDLPEALLDRFEVVINIPEPHPEALESLPEDLRDAAKMTFKETEPARHVTMRQWKSFANLRGSTDEVAASQAVFGKRAEEILDSLKLSAAE